MRTTIIGTIAVLLLVLAGCGGDGDDSTQTEAGTPVATTESSSADESAIEAPTAASEPEQEDSQAAAPAPPPASGGASASLTLANGESFEFGGLLCALEPQMAAGSEILFTAVSYEDPGLDITQFGDAGTVTGLGSISVYDGSYATLWEASSLFEGFGGAFRLSLDGSTISGGGTFYAGGELDGETSEGELTANC
jgi:hypothetical protein